MLENGRSTWFQTKHGVQQGRVLTLLLILVINEIIRVKTVKQEKKGINTLSFVGNIASGMTMKYNRTKLVSTTTSQTTKSSLPVAMVVGRKEAVNKVPCDENQSIYCLLTS